MGYKLLIAVIGAALAGSAAQAQTVTAKNPQTIVDALQKAGYKAVLETLPDSEGPMVRSASSGSKYSILFYGCTAGINCATVQFYTSYDFDRGKEPTLAKINDWNRENRFGRAYLDKENDPAIEMDVDLDHGGMSEMLFLDNLEFWTSVMAGFEKHLGW